MNSTTAPELIQILSPVYSPCSGFTGSCSGVAIWDPIGGYVPRGFVGAIGSIKEVEVVILVAEPGDPQDPGDPPLHESYPSGAGANEFIGQCSSFAYKCLEDGKTLFHRNLRRFLDYLFPGATLNEQLTRTWITETYLCSAPTEGGSVRAKSERYCRDNFLAALLAALPGRPVIALGGKAQNRVKGLVPDIIRAFSVAPPGANQRKADPSWQNAAQQARQRLRLR